MKYPSQELVNEHEAILLGLNILEQMTNMIQEAKLVEINDIEEMLGFLRVFADKCHHGKEEDLLFPAMEEVGIPNERGPIGQMLIEHNEGRKYIGEMAASIQEGNLLENNFIQAAGRYITLLRAHINKENKVLFPLGDKMLPIDKQKELMLKFQEFEQQVMGLETHEKFHELLHNLQNKYQG